MVHLPLPAYLLSCLWVQVGVQQGDSELYLPGAPGFHGGAVVRRGGYWTRQEQQQEEEMIHQIRIRVGKTEEGKEVSTSSNQSRAAWSFLFDDSLLFYPLIKILPDAPACVFFPIWHCWFSSTLLFLLSPQHLLRSQLRLPLSQLSALRQGHSGLLLSHWLCPAASCLGPTPLVTALSVCIGCV